MRRSFLVKFSPKLVSLGFFKAETMFFYCAQIREFLNILSTYESDDFIIPFGVLFKHRMIKIKENSPTSLIYLFEQHSASVVDLFFNVYAYLCNVQKLFTFM